MQKSYSTKVLHEKQNSLNCTDYFLRISNFYKHWKFSWGYIHYYGDKTSFNHDRFSCRNGCMVLVTIGVII